MHDYTQCRTDADLLSAIEDNFGDFTLNSLNDAAVGDLVLVERFIASALPTHQVSPVTHVGKIYLTVAGHRYAKCSGNSRRGYFRNIPDEPNYKHESRIAAPLTIRDGIPELIHFIRAIKASEAHLALLLTRVRIEQMLRRPEITLDILQSVFNQLVMVLP